MLVYQRVLTIDWLWSRVVKTRGRNGCFSADVLIDSHKPQRCSSLPLRSVLLGGFLKVWQDFLEMWKKWTRNWNPKQWASKRGFHSWMWPCLGFLKYEYPIVSPGASSFSPFGGFQQWDPKMNQNLVWELLFWETPIWISPVVTLDLTSNLQTAFHQLPFHGLDQLLKHCQLGHPSW